MSKGGRRLGQRAAYLAGDKQVLTLDDAFLNGLLQAKANLSFVAIVAGSIEVSVTDLDSLVDSLLAKVVVELPGAHTDLGEFLAGGVKGDVGGRHVYRMEGWWGVASENEWSVGSLEVTQGDILHVL